MNQSSGTSTVNMPSFRFDLHTVSAEEDGHRFVDVSDPVNGKTFRFYEVEYAVACGMDGNRSIADIVNWAKSELELQTDAEEVSAVVSQLAKLEYLAAPSVEVDTSDPSLGPPPVELGSPGKSPISRTRDSVVPPVDVELGMAGPADRPLPASAPSDVELGVAGRSDFDNDITPFPDIVSDPIAEPSQNVSTDLSQTFRLNQDEVKAAVRKSKVISAVVPEEDLHEDIPVDDFPVDTRSPDMGVADLAAQIAEDAKQATGNVAIVLPEEPSSRHKAKEQKPATATAVPEAQKPIRAAPILLWLILLGAVAYGAYFYYNEYYLEPGTDRAPVGQTAPTPNNKAAQQPERTVVETNSKPRNLPTTKVSLGQSPISEVKANRSGVTGWIVDSGTAIKAGDILVKISGFERLQKRLEAHEESFNEYQTQYNGLVKRGASQKRQEAKAANMERKKNDVRNAKLQLELYLVRSPVDGVVESLRSVRKRFRSGDTLAKVTGPPTTVAQFTLPVGTSAAVDKEMVVVSVSDPNTKSICKVTASDGQLVTLLCPNDSGFVDQTEVKLHIE